VEAAKYVLRDEANTIFGTAFDHEPEFKTENLIIFELIQNNRAYKVRLFVNVFSRIFRCYSKWSLPQFHTPSDFLIKLAQIGGGAGFI